MFRLGVVSFLNSRPLIEGLDDNPAVSLRFDVPARLPMLLEERLVDASLVPVLDVLREPRRYAVVSDACIACDGETMTVRVFSQVPPDRLRTLHVDPDSHTSVALARVLWRALYGRTLEVRPLPQPAVAATRAGLEAVLLIGDKVVDAGRGRFAYETDLGGAWRAQTGLPFVFAVWAAGGDKPDSPDLRSLEALLEAARDRGEAQAAEIARREGPRHGWPAALAERYLVRCLRYRLDARALAGVERFAELCRAAGLLPAGAATGIEAAAVDARVPSPVVRP